VGGAVCGGALVDVVFVNVFEAGPVVVCCCLTMAAVGGLDLRPDCCLTVESTGIKNATGGRRLLLLVRCKGAGLTVVTPVGRRGSTGDRLVSNTPADR
jgi:hypothetical protein